MGVLARDVVLGRFAWIGGHADVWAVFRDAEALRTVVAALAEPFRAEGITAVCGIESRGFLLGGAVAVELGVGFVLTDRRRSEVGPVHALVHAAELPADG
jgi:adenine phosphoribosyltransferase